MKLHDYDKALADYSEVIKLKPNEVRYVNYRAYIYELKKDLKNSMADTDKVLKLDPNNPEAKARKSRLSALDTANAPFTPIPAPSRKPTTTPHHKPSGVPIKRADWTRRSADCQGCSDLTARLGEP